MMRTLTHLDFHGVGVEALNDAVCFDSFCHGVGRVVSHDDAGQVLHEACAGRGSKDRIPRS